MSQILHAQNRNGQPAFGMYQVKSLYKLGVDIEIIAQGVGYAVDIVKEWVGLSPDVQ